MSTTLLENCRIPPAPEAAAELSLPLSFFDMKWLHFHLLHRLIFYRHPVSNPHFLNSVLPHLKKSLSLTLKHYLPVAGNLLYPSAADKKPFLRYVAGDSAPLTVAESSRDFDALTGNHPRDSDQFYVFVPKMPPIEDESDFKIVPIFALQITLFPGKGICVGFSNHHCLGDARSIVGFISAWAEINRLGVGDDFFVSPTFDRSFIRDPTGIDAVFWNFVRRRPLKPSSFPLPTNRVRATFLLRQSDLQKLKEISAASTFVAVAAYVWSCMVKSDVAEANAPELFVIPADARGRTDPPVPENYFGNCIVGGAAMLERGELAGEGGFVAAAEAIGREIKNRMNKKEEILKGAENWMTDIFKYFGMSVLGISGSPKFDLSNADFGWGRAAKVEVVSIDEEKYAMSLCKSSDSGDGGDLEVGLSLPRERMEAFAAVFTHGLLMNIIIMGCD